VAGVLSDARGWLAGVVGFCRRGSLGLPGFDSWFLIGVGGALCGGGAGG
jgi:hypothetical protein